MCGEGSAGRVFRRVTGRGGSGGFETGRDGERRDGEYRDGKRRDGEYRDGEQRAGERGGAGPVPVPLHPVPHPGAVHAGAVRRAGRRPGRHLREPHGHGEAAGPGPAVRAVLAAALLTVWSLRDRANR